VTASDTEFKLQANGVGSSLRIAGPVSGGGKVSASGAGTVILDNENNSWSGGTVVSAGFLLALSPGTLPGYDVSGSVVAGPWTEIGGVAMNVGAPVPGANVTGTWADADIKKLFDSFGFWNDKARLAYHVPEGAVFASSYAPAKRFTSIGKGELRLLSSAASTAGVRVESGRIAVDSGEKEGAIGEILLKGEGVFEMRSGSLVQSSGAFDVGGAAGGVFSQTGGDFRRDDTNPAKLAADDGAYGRWFMEGGSLALAGGLAVGSGKDAFGFFVQKSGEVSFLQKNGVNPVLALGDGGDAMLAVAGGVFDTKAFSALSWSSYLTVKMGNGEVGNAVLAVSGKDAVFSADKFLMGGYDGAQTNIIALSEGGVFEAGRFFTGTNGDNTQKYLNPFNAVLSDGGVIRPSDSWSWNDIAAGNYLRNPSRCVIFGKGLAVDTSLLSNQSTVSLDFEPPSGKGFGSIALPAEAKAAVYSGAARIVISDSTGWGAVAYADFDKATGRLAQVKIVSPGCDYSDAPTVAVESPDGKTLLPCTFTLAENVSGGLVKRGAQILEVYGENTTRGDTVVESGVLKVMTEQAAPAESVVRVCRNAELQLIWSVTSLRAAGGAGAVSRISGGGAVTLTEGIVAYADDMLSGEAITFADGVTFADGAVVGVADAEKLQGRQGRYLVASAVNGTIGGALPVPSPSLPDAANFKVVLSADAKRLYLSNMTGMLVIVR
jgi:autotransporter-associated beta strand protein